VVEDVGRGSIWSDGKGCAVGAFPSRMTVGMLIESMSSSIANSLVAVVSYSGYDLEDAVVFSILWLRSDSGSC